MTERRERDSTVVVTDGDRSSGLGTILGVVLIVALLVAVWYFTLGPGAGKSTTPNNGGGGTNPLPSVVVPSLPAAS